MIKTIEIKNFQSHVHTTIELSEFTALVGKSSSGKTSIMRSLLWVFYGDWDDTFPYNPEEPTAVSIELDSGVKIIRMRLHDENKAAILQPGQDPLKYKDFGYIIPGVFDFINVRPIQSGKQKINLNFSTQDEPLFMLSEAFSKPARAQWLGRLYGAHVVNGMLRLMSKDKKDSEAGAKALETEETGLKTRLEAFKGLEGQEGMLDAAEGFLSDLEAIAVLKDDALAFRARADAFRAKRWVLAVDTAAMRKDVDDLVAARSIRISFDEAIRSAKILKERRPLLNTDLRAMRTDIDVLARMYDVKQRLQKVRDLHAKIKDRLPLLQADLGVFRRQAEAAKEMVSIREDRGWMQKKEATIASKSWMTTIDTAGLRVDLEKCRSLKELRSNRNVASDKLLDVRGRQAGVDNRLLAARKNLTDVLFKDAKCPLCGTAGAAGDDVAVRLKAIVGAQ